MKRCYVTYSASSKSLSRFFSGSTAGFWEIMVWTSLSVSWTLSMVFWYGPITPVIFRALARSNSLLVLLDSSLMITSQRPKHLWQGAQFGKIPEYPRAHLSQRNPSTPSLQMQWPSDRSHWGVCIPLESQSQAKQKNKKTQWNYNWTNTGEFLKICKRFREKQLYRCNTALIHCFIPLVWAKGQIMLYVQ